MEFEEMENLVRAQISQDNISEAFELLNNFFKDDTDLDEIALQSAQYRSMLKNKIQGITDDLDAELMVNKLRSNILQLLRSKKEYLKYKKMTFGVSPGSKPPENDLITVFFSVGSPHNDKQQKYINELTGYFESHGIKLETLKGWDDNDPLLPIIEEMKKSSGCLVLALERYYLKDGIQKRGSQQESELKDQAYASPWLHIETALARSFDLPLIILKDNSLVNEGLIHSDKQEWGIVRINHSEIGEIKEYPVKNFILSWINQVKKFHKERNGN